jgi:hypothetical protein
MTPPTSKVWKFFKRCNDLKTVKCQLCEVELTYTGGTTNMLNHIRLKHSVQDESAPGTPDKQSSVISFLCSQEPDIYLGNRLMKLQTPS